MIGQIVSPFLSASSSAAPSSPAARPAVAEQPVAAAPTDVVTTSSTSEAATASATDGEKMSIAKRAGVAAMAGVALLGAGILAPSAAQAQTFRGHYGHSQVYTPAPVYHGGYGHRGGISPGAAFGLGVLGGIILGETLPPPVVYGGPVYGGPVYGGPVYGGPVVVNPGYNAYGCDGVYHHFDSFGNVTDASGHYRLIQNQWGQCMRVPAQPY